jgi:hypothetical protein
MKKHHPLPNEEVKIRQKILERIQQKQVSDPEYSLRGIARQADLNPGSLSYYLKGERSLNLETLFVIMKELGFSPVEMAECTSVSQQAYFADEAGDSVSWMLIPNDPECLRQVRAVLDECQARLKSLPQMDATSETQLRAFSLNRTFHL